MKNTFKGLAFLICFQLFSCANTDDEYVALTPEEREQYSGGEISVFNTSEEAFGFSAPNLTF
ncbi:thiol oxidoreductase, partial [Flavobacterium sp. XS1P32]